MAGLDPAIQAQLQRTVIPAQAGIHPSIDNGEDIGPDRSRP